MFITVTIKETSSASILNVQHIVGVIDDGEGDVYIKMIGSDPAFKIVETIDQMEKLLSVANK